MYHLVTYPHLNKGAKSPQTNQTGHSVRASASGSHWLQVPAMSSIPTTLSITVAALGSPAAPISRQDVSLGGQSGKQHQPTHRFQRGILPLMRMLGGDMPSPILLLSLPVVYTPGASLVAGDIEPGPPNDQLASYSIFPVTKGGVKGLPFPQGARFNNWRTGC